MATITIGSRTYDSYDTVADADDYLAADALRGPAWLARSDDKKGPALVTATRLAVRLPWVGGVAPDFTNPPQPVKDAVAIMAADIAGKPALGDGAPAGSNTKRAKAGPVEVEYFKPTDNAPPISSAAWDILIASGLLTLPGGADLGIYVSGIWDGCRSTYYDPAVGDWPEAC